jgi:hypothetical protein|tara:strand:+ start:8693 stop:8860 length:168 start_codon:yes stop_codon:yes gene_type:complete
MIQEKVYRITNPYGDEARQVPIFEEYPNRKKRKGLSETETRSKNRRNRNRLKKSK